MQPLNSKKEGKESVTQTVEKVKGNVFFLFFRGKKKEPKKKPLSLRRIASVGREGFFGSVTEDRPL